VDDLVESAHSAFELAARLRWKSHDPFDALLSPVGRPLQTTSRLAARVLVQAGKRTGAGFRRLLHVPEHEEAKTFSDFLSAAAMLAPGAGWAQACVDDLSRRLRAAAIELPTGRGWGYAFPYTSRFVSAGRGVPNLYVTTAACQALLDRHDLDGDAAALGGALDGCRFILDGLGWIDHRGSPWLRYWPGSESPVVNVQASGASLLARAARAADDDRLAGAADRAVEAVLSTQRSDGGWLYSADGRGDFVDGFHTGFTLQGLVEYAAHRPRGGLDVADAIGRGFAYFEQHLLTADGLPRGQADGKPSLDGQNVAQCIQTLVVCDGGPSARERALRLWRDFVRGLLTGESAPRSYPALRWDLAPAVLATAHLARTPSSSSA
jgi:hypothetical protein